MPFLTDLDSRAEVKGSRDPLGLVPMWARFGREVVGNLTTVTSSVRGFTTLLVGLELADMLQEQLRNDAPARLPTFLRFEQLAGYARVKTNGDREVRGYRRVARRLTERRRVRISADADDQILSSQKMYGLWGLFSAPARASELLISGEQRPTEDARGFVERHYFPMLGNGAGLRPLLDLLRRESFDLEPDGRHADLLVAIGRIHSRRLRADERTFYREHLAYGGSIDSTHGKQPALAQILEGIDAEEFGFREFRAVQKKARGNEALSMCLEKIGWLERLIAPAALLFGFLQNRDGRTAASTAEEIAHTWQRPLALDLNGLRMIQAEMAAALQSDEEAALWLVLAEQLARGGYSTVVELLVRINTSVMRRRHGAAAWIALEGGRIRVRLADEPSDLVSINEAEKRWRSTYFINSLWQVARDVREST
jgi:hypothetical protein